MSKNVQHSVDHCFQVFKTDIRELSLPEKFTFPFYYTPHPLTKIAAQELQDHLKHQSDWEHNFGLTEGRSGLVIGKMFGVLVVQNDRGELGYLSAFSGKLANKNVHPGFVPPVFDILKEDGFFKKGEVLINNVTLEIERLENAEEWHRLKTNFEETSQLAQRKIEEQKEKTKKAQKTRRERRSSHVGRMTPEDEEALLYELKIESLSYKAYLKDFTHLWNSILAMAEQPYRSYLNQIGTLKKKRRKMSVSLQQQIFDEYYFLNGHHVRKSLGAIFEEQPPAGAGECAAPKLLHFAFLNNLKPVALAEFWWGASPKSEIRKHGMFYPACRGKCEPILGHMLEGVETDPNPMLIAPEEKKEITVVYEDEHMAVINKPSEFLSVPGKSDLDSVYERMQNMYPDANGPLIVHRLDMATSGLMLIAKTKDAHKRLQRQFIQHSIQKRYIALLDGIVKENEGIIELPLRVDLDDRPRQLVCYEYGKQAKTIWEVIERTEKETRVHFYPVTGRTHQLRVHAAHHDGLNTPIIGDDLYGNKGKRLHLHAEYIRFEHPFTRKTMKIQVDPDF